MRREICMDRVPGETRVCLLEDGAVVELLVEREGERGITGNIYLGRVRNILPGMQAAFVDLGLERDGFLYVEDAIPPTPAAGAGVDGADPPDEASGPAPHVRPGAPAARIEDVVREGQEIVVQVAKDPIAQKGARITTQVALPGRLLVWLPGVAHIGVSRRIEDEEERERLRAAVGGLSEALRAPGGFIVRTAALGLATEAFEEDMAALLAAWEAIGRRRGAAVAPALLHEEAGAVERALRDMTRDGIDDITVDSGTLRDEVRACLDRIGDPGGAARVRLHAGIEPLFEERGIQAQIERALRPRVWLRSGGHIVLNQTEALVAIDVNTGKFVGGAGLEETIVRTNLEAVGEIVRQIRLRGLGGIIVVDFIDMREADDRAAVLAALEQELRKDRARSRVLQISEFGLVEITRQRTRPSLERQLCRPCPTCGGGGLIRSAETLAMEIARGVRRRWGAGGDGRVVVKVAPEAEAALREQASRIALAADDLPPGRLAIVADADLRPDQWSLDIEE